MTSDGANEAAATSERPIEDMDPSITRTYETKHKSAAILPFPGSSDTTQRWFGGYNMAAMTKPTHLDMVAEKE
jgi:hypothetical protein